MTTPERQDQIQRLMAQARETLTVSADNLELGHYRTSVNRSYYAVFYAANALLLSIGEPRSKHHGVLSAFRQYFIKPKLWPTEFSHIYGSILEERESGDYRLFTTISRNDAETDLKDAIRFVDKADSWLKNEGFL